MRERRTAQILMIFGIVLAFVELYVIIANLWQLSLGKMPEALPALLPQS
ncbi:hypothetical protein EV128_103334 [Rhizobium azibense]|nr:hypothetical protein EV128_103334 [Rhizobium azibense]